MIRQRITIVLVVMLLFSCSEKEKGKRYLSSSSGNINSISLVADNLFWEGSLGEVVREIFAAPLVGLPQDEPIFSIRQMPPQVFNDFATKNRLILKIEKADTSAITIARNVYAKPQTFALVQGKTETEIGQLLRANSAAIIEAFNQEEVSEKLRRINKSLLKDEQMETDLKFKIDIPSAYRIAKSEKDFYWLRKSLTNSMTMDFMFYSVPLSAIRSGDSAIVDIVRMRDSIIEMKIPGEDGIVMSTEDAYTPSLFETTIDGLKAYETRGMWEIKGQYMAGPFINYAIEDRANNRYLIAEGYVYAPSLAKREYIFEEEAILKSIRIK